MATPLRTVLLADGPFAMRFDIRRLIDLEDRYGTDAAIFDAARRRPRATTVALLWAARAGDSDDDVRARIAGMPVVTTLLDVLDAFHSFFNASGSRDCAAVVGATAYHPLPVPRLTFPRPRLGGALE